MGIVLGIDTGGTFTDAVLWDTNDRRVLRKAKEFTTPDNLATGIETCIKKMNLRRQLELEAVHLSTTLTVNAILEDKFTKLGLILIGRHLSRKLPVQEKYEILKDVWSERQGRVRFSAKDLQPIRKQFAVNYPAVLISAAPTLNQSSECIEASAADFLEGYLDTELICCSSISDNPELYGRTLEAAVTMGLRPELLRWIDSIQITMGHFGIHAPIRLLTGSGELVPIEQALDFPLDTILTGPAASYVGSKQLSRERNYLLLDIGGTSLDITKIENGKTRFKKDASVIGNYEFQIRTLDLQSFATGGDSHIKLNSLGDVTVGPEKVTPLCILGSRHPHLIHELFHYRLPDEYDLCTASETDCYFANIQAPIAGLHRDQLEIVHLLAEKPHSLFYIADHFQKDADALHIDQLVKKGYLHCSSLTPTDILHAEGIFHRWDSELARAGTQLLAARKNCGLSEFISMVKTLIIRQLTFSCMQSIAGFEEKEFLFSDSDATMYLVEKYLDQQSGLVQADFSIQKPIVGVGAPAGSWLPDVAEKLNAKLILPQDGDVAGAIGAAAAEVRYRQ